MYTYFTFKMFILITFFTNYVFIEVILFAMFASSHHFFPRQVHNGEQNDVKMGALT